ncbi:unnamed protein product [Nezara viridula]|uniref:Uncharacterized protein n=1 Tax=Nezara viridula TaxID=85310 RepID=A0A9P0H774_NEZVI|nr:unnamed protein product [Nezara viridula]
MKNIRTGFRDHANYTSDEKRNVIADWAGLDISTTTLRLPRQMLYGHSGWWLTKEGKPRNDGWTTWKRTSTSSTSGDGELKRRIKRKGAGLGGGVGS